MHGYGRVIQIVQQIEDIWRNPEKAKEYKKTKEKHLKFLENCINELED